MVTTTEIQFDFDYSMSTEDRFAVRKFLDRLLEIFNRADKLELSAVILDSAVATGFVDYPLQKTAIIDLFYRKFFGRRTNYLRLPKLKLTFNKSMFKLDGLYEEYQDGVLSAFGSIEIFLINDGEKYLVAGIKFYPRMRQVED